MIVQILERIDPLRGLPRRCEHDNLLPAGIAIIDKRGPIGSGSTDRVSA